MESIIVLDKNGKQLYLNDNVKDDLTGLKGVMVCVTYWNNGCVRIGLQPRIIKDGMPVSMSTIDIEDVVSLETRKKVVKKVKPAGGPKPNPVRR